MSKSNIFVICILVFILILQMVNSGSIITNSRSIRMNSKSIGTNADSISSAADTMITNSKSIGRVMDMVAVTSSGSNEYFSEESKKEREMDHVLHTLEMEYYDLRAIDSYLDSYSSMLNFGHNQEFGDPEIERKIKDLLIERREEQRVVLGIKRHFEEEFDVSWEEYSKTLVGKKGWNLEEHARLESPHRLEQ